MARRGKKAAKPADPMAIMLARARERELERNRARDPAWWGVSPQLLGLESANDVDIGVDTQGRVYHARRSDPFDLLHAAVSETKDEAGEVVRRRGLSDWQHQAARNLIRLYCQRHGVRVDDPRPLDERIDDVKFGAVEVAMTIVVDAQTSIRNAFSAIGPVNAQILHALIEPMIAHGAVIAWRGVIERVTGETDRHVQGAMVRQACEALRLVWRIGPMPELEVAA